MLLFLLQNMQLVILRSLRQSWTTLIYTALLWTVFVKDTAGDSDDYKDIDLNIEKISELGNTDILLGTISRLALALNKCGVDVRGLKELQRVMLPSGTNAKCMDGTNAGYVIVYIVYQKNASLFARYKKA